MKSSAGVSRLCSLPAVTRTETVPVPDGARTLQTVVVHDCTWAGTPPKVTLVEPGRKLSPTTWTRLLTAPEVGRSPVTWGAAP
mgnify:CR=1 FL=1